MVSAPLKQESFLTLLTVLSESVPFMQIQVTAEKRKGKEKNREIFKLSIRIHIPCIT